MYNIDFGRDVIHKVLLFYPRLWKFWYRSISFHFIAEVSFVESGSHGMVYQPISRNRFESDVTYIISKNSIVFFPRRSWIMQIIDRAVGNSICVKIGEIRKDADLTLFFLRKKLNPISHMPMSIVQMQNRTKKIKEECTNYHSS